MERDMNKIIAICAAQIYLWEQERQIHAICDCARERGYEVMIYNLSVKMDVETSHSRGELSVFSVIPYDQLAALVVLGESIRNDVVSDDLVAKAHKNNVPVVIAGFLPGYGVCRFPVKYCENGTGSLQFNTKSHEEPVVSRRQAARFCAAAAA